MDRIGVVYWSGTGNTQKMAEAVAQGAKSEAVAVADTTATAAAEYDKLLLGCPAMGAEVLEESEFEPFFAELEGRLSGKTVALFGSFGWGDGEWMREWEIRVRSAGANLFEQGLMINETPDEAALDDCRAFGARFEAL